MTEVEVETQNAAKHWKGLRHLLDSTKKLKWPKLVAEDIVNVQPMTGSDPVFWNQKPIWKQLLLFGLTIETPPVKAHQERYVRKGDSISIEYTLPTTDMDEAVKMLQVDSPEGFSITGGL